MNTEHLDALQLNLSHERARLHAATSPAEREMRSVWVAQLEREVAAERALLGLPEPDDVSDDDLLRDLT